MFSCFHTTNCEADSFTTDGYGIFKVRTNVGACRTHEGVAGGGGRGGETGGGGGRHKQVCTRVDSEGPTDLTEEHILQHAAMSHPSRSERGCEFCRDYTLQTKQQNTFCSDVPLFKECVGPAVWSVGGR